MSLPDVVVFGDAGGPALVAGFFFLVAIGFIGVGLAVGLVVYLIVRGRARRKLTPPAFPPYPPSS